MERPRDIRHGNNQIGYIYGNKFNDSNFNKNNTVMKTSCYVNLTNWEQIKHI